MRKNFNELESLIFKKFQGGIESVHYEDLDNYYDYYFDEDGDYNDYDDDEYKKIGTIRRLFKEFDKDYYKPIITDVGFAGEDYNYIEYTSKEDRYENLSPEEYLNMIRPYLRDLINDHKPTAELNDNNNNNNNNNNNRGEWKIQLTRTNKFISVKDFEDTRTIYSHSKPVELFMGSDTENIIDTLFNAILKTIHEAMKTSNERGSGFTHDSVELLL